MPLVTNGLCGSFGTVFLLAVIPTLSSTFAMSLPVLPVLLKSKVIRWFSVIPPTISIPSSISPCARAFAFLIICAAYSLNSGFEASRSATAFAAIICSKGPPCIPGKIALSIPAACSALHIVIPPLGPLSDLWVVVVTKSA